MARSSLASQIAHDIRHEIASGELTPGTKLLSEHKLSQKFAVSRSTIRSALTELEALGLIQTRHGAGSYVVDRPAVQAGLQELASITDSIRETGREPGMIYARRVIRAVMPEEADQMKVSPDTEVLELRREISGDGETLAYSYDLIPTDILPPDFDYKSIEGSLFALFREKFKVFPHHSTAEIRAISSNHVGWGVEADAHQLFVLLKQLHYDVNERLLLYSRTYFIDGRYSFNVYRSVTQPR